jgi:hypothetical protein
MSREDTCSKHDGAGKTVLPSLFGGPIETGEYSKTTRPSWRQTIADAHDRGDATSLHAGSGGQLGDSQIQASRNQFEHEEHTLLQTGRERTSMVPGMTHLSGARNHAGQKSSRSNQTGYRERAVGEVSFHESAAQQTTLL